MTARRAGILFYASLALTGLGTLFGLLAFGLSYEPDIGYFARGAVLPVLFAVILLLGAALALFSAWRFRKETMPKTLPQAGSCLFFVTTFAAFMSAFEAVFRVFLILGKEDFFRNLFSARSNRISMLSDIFDLLSVVFALLTAVAFYLLGSDKVSRKRKVAFGMIPCVRCLLGILQIFFDTTLAINLPVKLIGEFSLMAAVLFFLAEERMRISAYYARPSLYLASSVLAMGTCGAGGISLLFFYFKYRAVVSAQYGGAHYGQICLEGVFCCLVFLYVLFRFVNYVRAVDAPAPVLAEEASEETDVPAEEAAGTEKSEEAAGTANPPEPTEERDQP